MAYYSNTMLRNPSDKYVSNNSTICGCFSLQQILASRFKSSIERPGLEINFSMSTIFTAYNSFVSR